MRFRNERAIASMKYGALSAPAGTLDFSSIADGENLVLTWLKHGGPKVIDPVGRDGFGSKLVQRSVTGQLSGTIDYDWVESGLVVTLRMGRGRLAS